MKHNNVAVIGATGMVGQRFVSLLEHHPWFDIAALAASSRSAGKTYAEAVGTRWAMTTPMPEKTKNMIVLDAVNDAEKIAATVDFVFCAVDMPKEEIRAEIIHAQRKRLGTKRGFIAVKSNCSLQSYVPALHPLMHFGITNVLACTYQAISGAGKTFETWPEMVDNVIPFIGGEEEKSEIEPLKLWGHIVGDEIVDATTPNITTQCLRVPVSDGHMAAVFVSFAQKPSIEEIKQAWAQFSGPAQTLKMAWLFPSVGCGKINNTTINSFASLTTRCAVQPAVEY